ncbi:hypothetical protein ACWFNE_19245 [Cellulomonas sp. NPDC055163]
MSAAVSLLVAVTGVLLTLTVRSRHALMVGIATVVVLAMLVPSFGRDDQLVALTIAASVAALVVALARSWHVVRHQRPRVLVLLFVVYTAVAELQNRSAANSALVLGRSLILLLFVVAVTSASEQRLPVLRRLLPVVVVTQLVLGLTEVVLRVPAFWPRPSGDDRIEGRVNYLIPELPGRVLGSTSSPLVYGTVAAVGVVLFVWMGLRTGRRRWFVAAAAPLLAVALSGSRGPVLAMLVALGVLAAARASSRQVVWYGLVALLAGIVALSVNVVEVLGFSDFEGSRSQVHRQGVLASAGRLVTDQGWGDVLLGHGAAATDLIGGLVGGIANVGVFDNQYVATLAHTGLVGLTLLVAVIVSGLRRGDALSRAVLVLVAVVSVSYDSLGWDLVALLFMVSVVGPSGFAGDGKAAAVPSTSTTDAGRLAAAPARRPVTTT